MTALKTVLSVFLASPSGLSEERDLVSDIANRLSATIGNYLDVSIDVYKWEHLIGGAGRPQEQINLLLDKCDVFVGLIHRVWGSATGDGHDSGFKEEFDRALGRWESTKSPFIALFFKDVDEASRMDPGPKLAKVLEFKTKIEKDHTVFYNQYEHSAEFGFKVMQLIVDQMHIVGKAGATGSGYSPTRAGAIAIVDEAPVAKVQLVEVLGRLAQTATGSSVVLPLDRDRLGLYACALSIDGQPLGPHLANRLYAKRKSLQLIYLEELVWFNAFVADLGRAKLSSEQILPFGLMLQSRESFTNHISDHAITLLRSPEENVRIGWLRLATAMAVVPSSIWSTEDRVDLESDAIVLAWSKAFEGASASYALRYWMSFLFPRIGVPILELLRTQTSLVSDYATAILQLLSEEPSVDLLAGLDPTSLLEPKVLALFGDTNIYATVSVGTLSSIIGRTDVRTPVKVSALQELLTRNSLNADSILEMLNKGSRYSFLHSDWTHAVEIELFDKNYGFQTFQEILKALGNYSDPLHAADLKRRLKTTYPEFAGSEITPVPLTQEMEIKDVTSLEDALATYYGTTHYSGIARELASGVFNPVNEYLSKARNNSWSEETIDFLMKEFRFIGLKYLAHLNSEHLKSADKDLIRECANGTDLLESFEAARWLLRMASSDDVDLLIRHSRYNTMESHKVQLSRILEKATLKKLMELLVSDVEDVAVCSLLELVRRGKRPPNSWLQKAIYGADSELRMVALDVLCFGATREFLDLLLDAYPTGSETYYYNVVVELDRRLSGMPVILEPIS